MTEVQEFVLETHTQLYDKILRCTAQLKQSSCQDEQTFWYSLWKHFKEVDELLEDAVYPPDVTWDKIVNKDTGESFDVGIGIKKASGLKCARCWKISLEPGHNFFWPDICIRCASACQELFDSGTMPGETWCTEIKLKGESNAC